MESRAPRSSPFFSVVGEGRKESANTTGANDDELLAIARAHGATVAQVRLA
ncbi:MULTISPECIES: hypothetical protein [unclassified Streptomyces]|uniref:hypothetical protein n=1 Tax=unclassified Streptomyces TaxID=2593676 RepID=UPI0036879279